MTAPESKGLPRAVPGGYWIYIAELESGQLYVGITDDIERRTAEHAQGKPSTRTTHISRLVRVLYKERHPDRTPAHKRERQIKRWTRAKKLSLSHGDYQALKALSKSRSQRSQGIT